MNQKKKLLFFAANVLALLGWISMNIYLPSISVLQQYFHAKPADLKLSISIFLIGFAFSQFFWGSISERLGRIKPILYGLCIAEAGTILLLLAPNIVVFNIARFIEGVGIGAAAVLTRALLADSYSKLELSKAFSLISTSANIMPALAPIVGGYLMIFGGWRAIFIFLLIYTSFLIFLFANKIAETHPAIKPDFKISHALNQYLEAVTHRQFLGYLWPYAFLSGGMIGFYAATPFIFIGELHMAPEHYAFLSIFTVGTYILGANLASILAKKVGFNRAILVGAGTALLAGIILLICAFTLTLNAVSIILPMMIYTFAVGLVAPNANASGMSVLSHMSGAAGAVMGATVYTVSAALSAVITLMNLSHLSSLAFYIFAVGVVVLSGFYLLILRSSAH